MGGKCIYVGRKETYSSVQKLIDSSSILREPQFTENIAELKPDFKTGAVLFDADAFELGTILDWMYAQAQNGKRYTMGLYSSATGKLITEDETL